MSSWKASAVALLAATSNIPAAAAQNYSSPKAVCEYFYENYPEITSFANSTAYVNINEEYWDAAAELEPSCIFAPTTAEEMSAGVKALVRSNTPFALKGGGHMAIAGYNNIDSFGVLLASTNLKSLAISEDQTSVAVGPGNNWGAVFNYIQEYGKAVVGGRMSIVGVPGLISGGGMSNFGNEFGWGSSNIDSYTCVLANGDIVNANATNQYADLFWALRGGGNSFCIIIEFQMQTLNVPILTAGQRAYGTGNDVASSFLDALYYMAADPEPDVKGAIVPIARAYSGSNGTSYNTMMFYNGNNTNPDFFANFSAPVLPPTTDTYEVMAGMGDASAAMAEGTDQVAGFREGWWILPIRADRQAIQIIHDTYFEMINEYFVDVTNWISGMAFNIISKEYVVSGINNGGDPMGVDPNLAPYIWIEESITWADEKDDATVQAFYEAVNANLTAQLTPLNVLTPFIYLNDANKAQDVWGGYPKSSVMLLQLVREKYDPHRVFTDLMPGGWKVDSAII